MIDESNAGDFMTEHITQGEALNAFRLLVEAVDASKLPQGEVGVRLAAIVTTYLIQAEDTERELEQLHETLRWRKGFPGLNHEDEVEVAENHCFGDWWRSYRDVAELARDYTGKDVADQNGVWWRPLTPPPK